MTHIFPDLLWYSSVSERKNMDGRCPYANVHRCHRYFESVSLLSDQGITTAIPSDVHDRLLQKWSSSELWPVINENATSISGGEVPNCFSNFCPEVAFDTFSLFASTVIKFFDEIDRDSRQRSLELEGAPKIKNWLWNYQYVEPLHYSECAVYSKIPKEKSMPNITINGNINGQVNVAGQLIDSPALNISLGDILSQINSSDATQSDKDEAKSKLKEFLAHPVVAAIIGGVASGLSI